jgi:hypothetical protein
MFVGPLFSSFSSVSFVLSCRPIQFNLVRNPRSDPRRPELVSGITFLWGSNGPNRHLVSAGFEFGGLSRLRIERAKTRFCETGLESSTQLTSSETQKERRTGKSGSRVRSFRVSVVSGKRGVRPSRGPARTKRTPRSCPRDPDRDLHLSSGVRKETRRARRLEGRSVVRVRYPPPECASFHEGRSQAEGLREMGRNRMEAVFDRSER